MLNRSVYLWDTAASKSLGGCREQNPIGCVVKGIVVNIEKYGIFVELEKGIEGLIHVTGCLGTSVKPQLITIINWR